MIDTGIPPITDRLTIRSASPAELDRIADIINDPPWVGSVALAGGVQKAMRVGRVFAHAGISPLVQHTVVAEVDGRVVAIMDASAHHPEVEFTPRLFLRLLVPGLRAVGAAGLWRFLRSRGAWGRVSFPSDAESYYIAELDVDSAHRNHGIGGVLLRHAEEQARRAGCPRMTLTTNITNPSQHLYERFGFRIRETKTDAEYQRYCGSPGRVLMVKELSQPVSNIVRPSASKSRSVLRISVIPRSRQITIARQSARLYRLSRRSR